MSTYPRFETEARGNSEMAYFALCKGIQISESWKFLLLESRILGFGIRNIAHGFRNQSNWRLESRIQVPLTNTVIHNCYPESTAWNPESSDDCQFPYMGRTVRYLQRFDLIACFIENPVPCGSITKAKGWTQMESLIS